MSTLPSYVQSTAIMFSAKKAGPKVQYFTGDSMPPPPSATVRPKARVVMHGSSQPVCQPPRIPVATPSPHRTTASALDRIPLSVQPETDVLAPPQVASSLARPEEAPLAPLSVGPELIASFDVYAASFEIELAPGMDNGAVPQPTAAEVDYWHALDVVESIFRLDGHLFVMQDWDEKEHMLEVRNLSLLTIFVY